MLDNKTRLEKIMQLEGKKVLVTGGEGFLGKAICLNLETKGAEVIVLKHSEVDLCNLADTLVFVDSVKPDYCIHAAGHNGGIEFNRMYPADILYANTVMGLNIHNACTFSGVKKIVSIMTSCAYPDTGMEVLEENTFWNGLPNKTIRAHGIAKRILQTASEAYKDQYDLDAVTVCITNLYGPYDTFNLVRTKVVGALIRKFVEAVIEEKDTVECWGTGAPMREFMYVADAAEAVVQSLQNYNDETKPLNIGTGKDISIKELVEGIVEVTGYKGEVFWNTDKPDGQLKKLLSTERMKEFVELEPTDFKDGLKQTINWYTENKQEADAKH